MHKDTAGPHAGGPIFQIKVCVFSDSHGCADHMLAAIRREHPNLCFFLGDGERDLAAVQKAFPSLPFYAVRGNCDLRSKLSASLTCMVGGIPVFAAHGHQHQVKYEPSYETLTAAAKEAGAAAALFGHTHCPYLSQKDGITLLNPGSIGRGSRPGYGLLTLKNGRLSAELKTVQEETINE